MRAEKVLAEYAERLNQEIANVEREIQSDPTSERLQDEFTWLKSELEFVQQKRKQGAITIGELERSLLAASSDRKVHSAELDRLDQRELELKTKLEQTDLTSTQRKLLEKELLTVEQAQLKEENKLLLTEAQRDLSTSKSQSESLNEKIGSSGFLK